MDLGNVASVSQPARSQDGYDVVLTDSPESLARVSSRSSGSARIRIGLVQHRWRPDPQALRQALFAGIAIAAEQGARVVFLPELTLSRYPADKLPEGLPEEAPESLEDGPTLRFARDAATRFDVLVHASLSAAVPEGGLRSSATTGVIDGRGINTAILVNPKGELIGRTAKLHIPVSSGYYEDHYFRPGPASGWGNGDPYPVYRPSELEGLAFGLPTCWDQWFPEVARSYGLRGANLLAYPTAIGSEPEFPQWDTEPQWRQVMVGHAIANGLFIAAVNRVGSEVQPSGAAGNRFYGSSFVVDPYGRVLARASRDRETVMVVEIEPSQRRDWLDSFPMLATRRPDTYGGLVVPNAPDLPYGE